MKREFYLARSARMHKLCISKLPGRVDRYDKHPDLRARVQERWDRRARTWAVGCEGRAENRKIEADHTLLSGRLCNV